MAPSTPTTDHDAGQPPLYTGPVGALVVVLLDGQRWAALPPGDPLADRLAADADPNEKPAARTNRGGLNFVWTTITLTRRKDSDNDLLHGDDARV